MGDRIAVLQSHGRLAQVGPPEEVLARPADEFVANFLVDGGQNPACALGVGTVIAGRGRPWQWRGPVGWRFSRSHVCQPGAVARR
jgi:ABC-type sugar transport system ATPase subunit